MNWYLVLHIGVFLYWWVELCSFAWTYYLLPPCAAPCFRDLVCHTLNRFEFWRQNPHDTMATHQNQSLFIVCHKQKSPILVFSPSKCLHSVGAGPKHRELYPAAISLVTVYLMTLLGNIAVNIRGSFVFASLFQNVVIFFCVWLRLVVNFNKSLFNSLYSF